MECARSISGRGGLSAKLTLLVRAPTGIGRNGSHVHVVSRIRLLANVGPAFLPRAQQ